MLKNQISARLKSLNLELPEAVAPVANYVPTFLSNNILYISGQLPMVKGSIEHAKGKVGDEISTEAAVDLAQQCGLNILAQMAEALDKKIDSIANVKLAKLGVFVNGTSKYTDHPKVANGASDLMVEVLGENGKHSRSAVGVGSLPLGVAVEIDAIFVIE